MTSVYHNALNIWVENVPNSSSKIEYRKESKFVFHSIDIPPMDLYIHGWSNQDD